MTAEIHISDVRMFKQCRRRWDFSSPLRRNLEPKLPQAALWLGRGVHKALQDYYEGDRAATTLTRSFATWASEEISRIVQQPGFDDRRREELKAAAELGYGMLKHYAEWAPKQRQQPPYDHELEYISTEHTFIIPIRTPSGRRAPKRVFSGRFDGVARWRGGLWLIEYKTTVSIDALSFSLLNDEQTTAYCLAAQEIFGEPVKGIIYTLLKKKVPTIPKMTQRGHLSRNKMIDTTYEVYRREIDEWELDPADYVVILELLRQKGNTFFRRTAVQKREEELRSIERDLYERSLEMIRPNTPIYPSPDMIRCRACPFFDPCIAMNLGIDAERMLGASYRTRKRYDDGEGSNNNTHGLEGDPTSPVEGGQVPSVR